MPSESTRIELLTPRGIGGVAVVAVHGPDREARVAELVRFPAGGGLVGDGTPRLAELWLGGEVVDQVLVVDRPEHESIELHLHGSDAVVDALDAREVDLAASPAQRLLRRAMHDSQLALALEQLAAPWSEFVTRLARLPVDRRRAEHDAARERSRVAMAIATPCRVVLCGLKNAGKSTLMNRLLFRERALAGDHPGLTRDPVRELTVLDGYPYELVDTAGEGASTDSLDAAAIDRARFERERADLRLLVVDGSRAPSEFDRAMLGPGTIVVRTKADLPSVAAGFEAFEPSVSVSCLDPAQAADVRATLGRALCDVRHLPPAGPVGGPAALDAEELRMLSFD